jgi:hypothetical protein
MSEKSDFSGGPQVVLPIFSPSKLEIVISYTLLRLTAIGLSAAIAIDHAMTSLPLPPPSFLYGIILSIVVYPPLFYFLSPLLVSKFATPSLQTKVSNYDTDKRYQFHSMLPSVIHALVQIVGVATVIFWGREGFDNLDERPSIVKFDERTFVPYGVSLTFICKSPITKHLK